MSILPTSVNTETVKFDFSALINESNLDQQDKDELLSLINSLSIGHLHSLVMNLRSKPDAILELLDFVKSSKEAIAEEDQDKVDELLS